MKQATRDTGDYSGTVYFKGSFKGWRQDAYRSGVRNTEGVLSSLSVVNALREERFPSFCIKKKVYIMFINYLVALCLLMKLNVNHRKAPIDKG